MAWHKKGSYRGCEKNDKNDCSFIFFRNEMPTLTKKIVEDIAKEESSISDKSLVHRVL